MSEQQAALRTENLSKRFPGLFRSKGDEGYAVKELNITVYPRDIYGFLGPNGSGKTTTIRMILGLVRPTAGTAFVFGKDTRKEHLAAAQLCGSIVDVPAFYLSLSARTNLRLFGSLSGNVEENRILEVLDLVGLSGRSKSKVRTFSHGMRQRLGFALAVLSRPKLLLLDEPTNGLDPEGNWLILGAIKRLRDEGCTTLLSSHLLSEVEQLCNRTAILRQGNLLYEGSVNDLICAENAVDVNVNDATKALSTLQSKGFTVSKRSEGEDGLRVEGAEASEINEVLVSAGIEVSYLSLHKQTLRDVFLKYMNDSGPA